MSEPTIIACLPVNGNFGNAGIPGNTKDKCKKCGSQVWVSPATRKTHDRIDTAEFWCLTCLVKERKGEELDVRLSTEQLEELRENLGPKP